MQDATKAALVGNRSLEFVWHSNSDTSMARSAILLHVLNNHTGYESPTCFDWEPDQMWHGKRCPQVNESSVQATADEYYKKMTVRSQ